MSGNCVTWALVKRVVEFSLVWQRHAMLGSVHFLHHPAAPARARAGDGSNRLSKGASGPGYEYGRLEIFLNGLRSDICSGTQFTPNSATLACRLLGYDGGSRLLFTVRTGSLSMRAALTCTQCPTAPAPYA